MLTMHERVSKTKDNIPTNARYEASEKIARDVRIFLVMGGKIQHVGNTQHSDISDITRNNDKRKLNAEKLRHSISYSKGGRHASK